MFGGKLIVLPNRGTDMMCQNTFGGKMIISQQIIIKFEDQQSNAGYFIKMIMI